MTTNALVRLSSAIELATGIGLIADPGLIFRLLFGADLSTGGPLGRLVGFALVSFALACWSRGEIVPRQIVQALFLYNLLAGLYLGYLRVGGVFNTYPLLAASILHVGLALLMARPALQGADAVGTKKKLNHRP
jgi:hypothetical protein